MTTTLADITALENEKRALIARVDAILTSDVGHYDKIAQTNALYVDIKRTEKEIDELMK